MLHHHDDEETSISEELAECRTAVHLVREMVAAEEGRAQRQVQARSVAVPSFVQYMEEADGEEEALPNYEDASVSSDGVADGLRYTPGSSVYNPSSRVDGLDGLDRKD